VQYPGFSQQFDQHAPDDVRGFCPPFLAPSIQPGQLQVWTGCIAKTAPGWSLLVRGVAGKQRRAVAVAIREGATHKHQSALDPLAYSSPDGTAIEH